ncbi:acyltransferase family protein [Spirochaeta cellobiosiphila]|uniref:acyltransferase family protein n=1 Tax=Spirochaeta cellobiosiphila TaxID=504483 RepID=UPI0003F86A3B
MIETNRQNDSTYFFNNIRATVVLLVILLHVVLAYSANSDKWWIVVDNQKSVIADILAGSLDIMLMCILFFIAGYFAYPSFMKCNSLQFFIKKIKNLMFPWLMGVLFLNPFLVNVIQFQRDNNIALISNTLSYYKQMIIQDRSGSQNFFSHYHFWFLSLLFYFFFGFILFKKIHHIRKNVVKSFVTDIILLVIISSLGYFLFYSLFEDKWFAISIIQFQISRIIPYIAFFIFGVRSYSNGWIYKMSTLRKPLIHLTISIGFTLLYLLFYVYVNSQNSSLLLLSISFMRYLICTYYLLIFLSIGKQFFDTKTFFSDILSRYSFGVYVIHLDMTILFSIIFIRMNQISPEIKIVFVFILTVITSYIIVISYNKIRRKIQLH